MSHDCMLSDHPAHDLKDTGLAGNPVMLSLTQATATNTDVPNKGSEKDGIVKEGNSPYCFSEKSIGGPSFCESASVRKFAATTDEFQSADNIKQVKVVTTE